MTEPRVVMADNAGLFTLDGTRSFLLGSEQVVVIDPGPDDPLHLQRLTEALRGARGGTILLSHGHPDHAAGGPRLAAATGFELVGHAPGATRPIREGEDFPVDGGWIHAVFTPGHARGHFAFLHGGDLFAGDLLLGEGSTTWVGEYPGCMHDYLDSLDRVQRLSPRRIFPAHGPVLQNPDSAVDRFRAHRLFRLGQIADLLEDGAWRSVLAQSGPERFVDGLVAQVHGSDLPSKARVGAHWSVRASLEHLGVLAFPLKGAPTEMGSALAPGS